MGTLLIKGKIYLEKGRFEEAIAIKGGFVEAVGSTEAIVKNRRRDDEVIDLQGKTVLPGLNDSHLHLFLLGEAMASCNLTGVKSIGEMIERGRDYLSKNRQEVGIHGRGWNQDFFEAEDKRLPGRKDLDLISTDIPIVYERVCGHVAVGNTKAMEMAGITEDTFIPGGTVERSPQGILSGVVTENATHVLAKALSQKDKEAKKNQFIEAGKYVLSQGITSVQSCDVSGEDFQQTFDWIREVYEEEKLPLRYRHQFNFQRVEDFRRYLNSEYKNGKYDQDYYQRGSLKLFKDGSLGGRTALLRRPYADDPTTKGVEALKDQELWELCQLAGAHGIPVITHAIGDGAVESVVKSYEKLIGEAENTLRHGIVHNQITSGDQLDRIIKNRIAVMAQPVFLDYDLHIVKKRVGEALAKTSYAFNTLYQQGGLISIGTDAPVEDSNPFRNIYAAVTRRDQNGYPEGGYQPEERMTIEEAVDAYTWKSAENQFQEDVKGKLLPGYFADLIVLDRDLFTVRPSEISDTQVELTMIDGKVVYRRE
ncbi:amidohydrolase [Isachenkonia alkalipeptolytica]|uniref:Amidohydrolase n=1 Tax=Isachenkonia alkalipeptolytica TaxID=2565777 RepID=A0AA43XN31_9CLOT|nr:amidohydrolase [Isachenkonia alkalipeptolytica]NBG89314.1 amidohydrolase [Isachenkonia alkalipeptolytica]